LCSHIGEPMMYQADQKRLIDFPGEYDIGDCAIK
jgi:hypothetical protein